MNEMDRSLKRSVLKMMCQEDKYSFFLSHTKLYNTQNIRTEFNTVGVQHIEE